MDEQPDNQKMKRDSGERLYFVSPRTGRLFVRNRAARFHKATAETHANDLTDILSNIVLPSGKTGVCLLVDGGPNYSVKSALTVLYFGRLWRDLLDFLMLVTHAPGDSAFNDIERAWSPLSRLLTGVTLPITLPDEEVHRSRLEQLDDTGRAVKVFDNALAKLNSHWDGKSYDGFAISSRAVACEDVSVL